MPFSVFLAAFVASRRLLATGYSLLPATRAGEESCESQRRKHRQCEQHDENDLRLPHKGRGHEDHKKNRHGNERQPPIPKKDHTAPPFSDL